MSIHFGQGVPWAAISQLEHQRMAKDHAHPMHYRVYFAALGWANRIGHAEFSEGGLRRILRSGDGKLPSVESVSNAIGRAKEKGLVHLDSGARCLVLGSWHFQKDGLGTVSCRTHQVRTV